MRKISLRLRLTLMTSLLLMVCCLAVLICVMNSALLQIDSIEAGTLSLTMSDQTDIMMNINMSDVFPEIRDIISHTKQVFLIQGILITVFVMAAGSLITWVISGIALKPVRDLGDVIRETTENNLHQRIEEPAAKDEVRDLTSSFNQMLDRLDAAFISQKQFSANAAHELRTPLAVMQTSLEVFNKKEDKTQEAYDQAINDTLRQVSSMNHLVDTMLEFQRMHTAELKDQVSISELAQEVVCDLESLADERGILLELEEDPEEDIFNCNEVLLYRAIYNLVENAIKYNRDGGKVSLKLSHTDGSYDLWVSDSGCGIAKNQWEEIFNAFYRVDKSRSRKNGGAGLGLAMVREIAELHHGHVCVEESSEKGTVIHLNVNQRG